ISPSIRGSATSERQGAEPMSGSADVVSSRVVMAAAGPAPGWTWVRLLVRRKIALVGAVLVVLNVLVAILAPAVARRDPQLLDVKARLTAPNAMHWFGTDDVGRDVWSRVVYGARLSMLVGGAVVLFSFTLGTVFGLLGGYYRPLDNVLMRIMDGLM